MEEKDEKAKQTRIIFQWVFMGGSLLISFLAVTEGIKGVISFFMMLLAAAIICPLVENFSILKGKGTFIIVLQFVLYFILMHYALMITPIGSYDRILTDEYDPPSFEMYDESDTGIFETDAELTDTTENKFAVIETFIQLFNERSDAQITNAREIDIHDKEGGYYRTEFRLNPFKNAAAVRAEIDDRSIDIINYGGLSNNIRIYFSAGSIDIAEAFLDTAIKLMNLSVTEEDIIEENSRLREYGYDVYSSNISYVYDPQRNELVIDCENMDYFENEIWNTLKQDSVSEDESLV